MAYEDRKGGLGVASPFQSTVGQAFPEMPDVDVGAYYNFLQDPKNAARNMLRSQGYNPTINPYQRQLASKLGQDAQLRNLVSIVRSGRQMDPRALAEATQQGMGAGLYPTGGALNNYDEVEQFMGDLNAMVRNSSDPTNATGMTADQRALAKMFEPNDAGQYNTDALSDFFSGLYDRFSSPLLRQLRQRMFEDSINDFRGTVAPSEPNRGLLDFLTGSLRIR